MLSKSRIAVSIAFFLNGAAVATWASRIPSIKEHLQLSDGPLGLALLSMAAGALLAMSMAASVCNSLGSHRVVSFTALGACLALVLPALAPNLVTLCLSVALLGVFLGSLDVAMNTQAVAVEKAFGSSIMSSFHALFSIGGVCGASLGAALALWKVGAFEHFLGCGLLLFLCAFTTRSWLFTETNSQEAAGVGSNSPLNALHVLLSSTQLKAIGWIMFACFLIEGAVGDWSGVFLRTVVHSDLEHATLGYACFSLTMCLGRLLGDRLVQSFGTIVLLYMGSIQALIGLLFVLLPAEFSRALFGFSLMGIGVSNIVPICFTAAGRARDIQPAIAIAAVSLTGYFGLLVGPPVIGFAAELLTLRIALAFLGILTLGMISSFPLLNKGKG